MILRWLLGLRPGPDYIAWDWQRAARAEAVTARMMLGACGPARVVGNRRDEQIVAERERRVAERRARAQMVMDATVVPMRRRA